MIDMKQRTVTGCSPPLPEGLPHQGRCLVMGILNVTPDSFSDGGRYANTRRAVQHGLQLARAGADLVDVGGESTRPGARPVPLAEELARVVPVVRELALANVRVSVDTMHAEVARAAVQAGACIVNDVSGGLADPSMAATVGAAQVPYVITHWRAPSHEMDRHAVYDDVVSQVVAELHIRVEAAVAAGVQAERIIIDPGLGFAKNAEQDWQLLSHLSALKETGFPFLIGASRKRLIRTALQAHGACESGSDERDAATAAVSALAASAGASCVRVHDVRSSLHAVYMASAWASGGRRAPTGLPPAPPLAS
ncbi:dihydropteroate synthase [Streptomyces sp. NPDC059785]|uniref:dihydropteroate synthase n=1 Tax=Streptomyces sp. NPDC059785 TaxID=3346945 RepID=UPI003648A00B